MMYDFVLLDVFTNRAFGGNQLAVLPRADGLSARQMQDVAREFNFAETTFVLPPEDPAHTHRLRIFSPGAEMPFAGHPTIGTAAALAHLNQVAVADGRAHLTFGEAVGPVDVEVTHTPDTLYAELTLDGDLDQPTHRPDVERVAGCLSLPARAVRASWFASVGLRFCFAHLATEADVDAAVLDTTSWSDTLKDAWAQHVYLFAGEFTDRARIYARMFAPGIGISEDPATGSAGAALAACLAANAGVENATLSLTIHQGLAMGRPSRINVGAQVAAGKLDYATVGGQVVVVGTGSLDLPG
jgi:trans-2,3-dihydro-3-hydroxyanthranilate isomerase